MIDALKRHWPEYIIEGACLGLFMVSAFTFGTVLEHPASSIHHAIPNPLLRRFLMGLAMGGTAIAIIYSPWGKQSGAHINPSTTAEVYLRTRGPARVVCAKLHHDNNKRFIFVANRPHASIWIASTVSRQDPNERWPDNLSTRDRP